MAASDIGCRATASIRAAFRHWRAPANFPKPLDRYNVPLPDDFACLLRIFKTVEEAHVLASSLAKDSQQRIAAVRESFDLGARGRGRPSRQSEFFRLAFDPEHGCPSWTLDPERWFEANEILQFMDIDFASRPPTPRSIPQADLPNATEVHALQGFKDFDHYLASLTIEASQREARAHYRRRDAAVRKELRRILKRIKAGASNQNATPKKLAPAASFDRKGKPPLEDKGHVQGPPQAKHPRTRRTSRRTP